MVHENVDVKSDHNNDWSERFNEHIIEYDLCQCLPPPT